MSHLVSRDITNVQILARVDCKFLFYLSLSHFFNLVAFLKTISLDFEILFKLQENGKPLLNLETKFEKVDKKINYS